VRVDDPVALGVPVPPAVLLAVPEVPVVDDPLPVAAPALPDELGVDDEADELLPICACRSTNLSLLLAAPVAGLGDVLPDVPVVPVESSARARQPVTVTVPELDA